MVKVLRVENVELNMSFDTKEAAIEEAGNVLLREGYVTESYINSMQEREKIVSVYVGNHVAVPHGVNNSQDEIINSGISVIQVPQGVSFGKDMEVFILFGIAGKGNSHIEILGNIAVFCSDKENVIKLRNAKSKDEIMNLLSSSFE